MKKYKYIGTEEQLVEKGFEIVEMQFKNSKGALKTVNDDGLYIPLFDSIYGERIIQYSPFGNDDEVLVEHIQDLIDANLVEVVE